MIPYILGIDLGTSGIKLLYSTENGTLRVRENYTENTPQGWFQALCRACMQLDLQRVRAVGLSSQVGTYIINNKESIGWSEPVGQAELEETLAAETQQTYLREISMPHPRILSYPLPRLRYIRNCCDRGNESGGQGICMPKDFLLEKLTGNRISDPYSWRGLANLETGQYSEYLLDRIGIKKELLPKLQHPATPAGYVTEKASGQTGIPAGTSVYVGCNVFFAGLLGMGMLQPGSMFDITGTSEHLGIITDVPPDLETDLVNGPYFRNYVFYGVTASSGASLEFGMRLHDLNDETLFSCLEENPPIFLPYVNGERAPVWDSKASGAFVGITAETDGKQMAYAVMEGVAFSLYHIYEHMGKPPAKQITAAGGAARNQTLNRIKAALFGIPLLTLQENDTSALGAQMIAAVGEGAYPNLDAAVLENCVPNTLVQPDRRKTKILRRRYEIYKNLYPALKQSFHEFRQN